MLPRPARPTRASLRARPPRAATFLDRRRRGDTESALTDGTLYVKFGPPTLDEDAVTAIGQAVADELRRAGLTVLGDGSLHQAVGVVGLNGRRRR